MSKIWYIGDLHGKVDIVAQIDRQAVKEDIHSIVQVGDFGIHWPPYVKTFAGFYALKRKRTCPILHYFNKRNRQNRPGPTWYTCGGNHDNWFKWAQLRWEQSLKQRYNTSIANRAVELAPGCYWMPRGEVYPIEGILHIFFGGAESIDKHRRQEFMDWWKEETGSMQEFDNFCDQANLFKPEIFVTHDCPLGLQFNDPRYKQRLELETPVQLDNLLKVGLNYIPSFWAYGHHHFLKNEKYENINFLGCGYHGQGIELDTVTKNIRLFNVLSEKTFKLENWNNREYI